MPPIQILPAKPDNRIPRQQTQVDFVQALLQTLAQRQQQQRQNQLMQLLGGATPETAPGLLQDFQQQNQPQGFGGMIQGLNPYSPAGGVTPLEQGISQTQAQYNLDPLSDIKRKYMESQTAAQQALATYRNTPRPAKPPNVDQQKWDLLSPEEQQQASRISNLFAPQAKVEGQQATTGLTGARTETETQTLAGKVAQQGATLEKTRVEMEKIRADMAKPDYRGRDADFKTLKALYDKAMEFYYAAPPEQKEGAKAEVEAIGQLMLDLGNTTPVRQGGLGRGQQGPPAMGGQPQATQTAKMGDIINKGGRQWTVVGFDADGTPLVNEVK